MLSRTPAADYGACQLNRWTAYQLTKEHIVIIKRLLNIAALIGIAFATTVAQAPDPLSGTWKLNATKSKAPYASGTTVFEAAGDTLKGTVDLVGTDGTKFHWNFSA